MNHALFIDTTPLIYSPSLLNLIRFLSRQGALTVYVRNIKMLVKEDVPVLDERGITVKEFRKKDDLTTRRLLGRVRDSVTRRGDRLASSVNEHFSHKRAYQEEQFSPDHFDQIICVDPAGFLFCKELCPDARPMYYSLEIYVQQDLLPEEVDMHKRLCASAKDIKGLIIQSEERASHVLRAYGLADDLPLFILPVTYEGPVILRRSSSLRLRYGIDPQSKIVLCLGGIIPVARSIDIARAFPETPDQVLIFHGHRYEPYVREMEAMIKQEGRTNVLISDQYFDDPEKVADLVAGADIGLAWYDGFSTNMRTAGHSSGKISLYLRCGLAVITNSYPSFREAVEDTQCGVCLDELTGLGDALNEVVKDLEGFAERARSEYDQRYRFQVYEQGLINFLAQGYPDA